MCCALFFPSSVEKYCFKHSIRLIFYSVKISCPTVSFPLLTNKQETSCSKNSDCQSICCSSQRCLTLSNSAKCPVSGQDSQISVGVIIFITIVFVIIVLVLVLMIYNKFCKKKSPRNTNPPQLPENPENLSPETEI